MGLGTCFVGTGIGCRGFVDSRRSACRRSPVVSLAKGFGKSRSSADEIPQAQSAGQVGVWQKEYKAFLKRNGKDICAMCYDGYRRLGRGAVFANYSEAMDKVESDIDLAQSVPSMYVPMDKLRESASRRPSQGGDMKHITDRVARYDPEKQFVVVFECNGVMGADIVTPNMEPQKVWDETRDRAFDPPQKMNFWTPGQ